MKTVRGRPVAVYVMISGQSDPVIPAWKYTENRGRRHICPGTMTPARARRRRYIAQHSTARVARLSSASDRLRSNSGARLWSWLTNSSVLFSLLHS